MTFYVGIRIAEKTNQALEKILEAQQQTHEALGDLRKLIMFEAGR